MIFVHDTTVINPSNFEEEITVKEELNERSAIIIQGCNPFSALYQNMTLLSQLLLQHVIGDIWLLYFTIGKV